MGARAPGAIATRGVRHAARPWYRRLDPGLLAGASDDDPSGTAVYAQAGSRYGFHLLWLPVVVLPMMVEVQLAAACVGVPGTAAIARASSRRSGGTTRRGSRRR
ncbi:hypothetical protein [Burkholderia stagnalis]|uniref:hypothetical protein n=1 Tax=Burkholderia stagnalis TaxID=1503054 RepID=UPI00075CD72D|nr:hypothetical protein WT07_13150 [Burkholderia stagnalis]KWE06709.1 hypothetical protein WT48_27920 [Burkholderia stagnalis]KWE11467.1 hypothetical protein WT47_07015 [Burkholderia stagnalis]KWO77979.1 hypothetical protein WU00_09260 [Burkholderia stagnalis]